MSGLVLLLLLVAGLFFSVRYYLTQSSTTPGTQVNPEPAPAPKAERQPRFVLAVPDNRPVRTGRPKYNLISYRMRDGKLAQRRLILPHPLVGGENWFQRNPLIQWNSNGLVMAYAVGLEAYPLYLRRRGPTRSYQLVVERSGRSEAIIDREEAYRYENWVLAPSGRFIVFVRSQSEGPQYPDPVIRSVYKYDLSSRQLTKLLDVPGFGIVGQMYLNANETQVTWLRYVGREFHRLSLDLNTGKTDDTIVYVKASEESFSGWVESGMLSPNHKFAVLRVQDGVDWKIKLLNMEGGHLTDLLNLGPKRSPSTILWSADSRSIAYTTVPFGTVGERRHTFEMGLIQVRSNAKTTLATSKTTGLRVTRDRCPPGELTPLAFSPDGKWLAYIKDCRLSLYDIARQQRGPTIYNFLRYRPPGYAWVGY